MASVGNNRLVAYADPQNEASLRNLGNGSRRRSHCDSIARPDIGNSRSDCEAFGMAEQIGRMGKWIAARALRYPESFVAVLLDSFREIEGLGRGHRFQHGPN